MKLLKNFFSTLGLVALFSQGAYGQMPGTFTPLAAVSAVGAVDCDGGIVSYSGGMTIHQFTGSDNIVCTSPHTVNFLAVAGAGGGGGYYYAAGGGGGGVKLGSITLPVGTTPITIGAGGPGGPSLDHGVVGNNTTIGALVTAHGGGFGGGASAGQGYPTQSDGGPGGSGGGVAGGSAARTPGTGIAGEGFAGGVTGGFAGATGGGGANQVGGTGTANAGGKGGDGIGSAITGTMQYYGPGGGGSYVTGGAGGLGGGGTGSPSGSPNCTPGQPNKGAGGGGTYNSTACAGGSGFVAIAYPTGTPIPQPTCTPNTQNGGTFANVKGLWHFDNNGNDSASPAHALTLTGGAIYSATQNKFGGYALNIVTAATSYASIAAGLSFGSGQFTFEGWLYFQSPLPTYFGWLSDDNVTFQGLIAVPNFAFYWAGTSVQFTSTVASKLTPNAWHHIAVQRDATGVFTYYIDGAVADTPSAAGYNTAVGNGTSTWRIGRGSSATYVMPTNSFIDEIRISNIARYTASFSPPLLPWCDN